jgi:hypothetical protein
MHVLMTSTSYPKNSEDWRGRFISELVSALARNHGVSLALWAPDGSTPDNIIDVTSMQDKRWLRRLVSRGGIASLIRNNPMTALSAIVQLLFRLRRCYRNHTAEVCHVNWLQNGLPLWGTRTPALITVLGSDFGLLRFPGMTAMLRAVLRQRRTILAPNADWMRPGLLKMFGDVAEIRTIAFGVDPEWFEVVRNPVPDCRCWIAVTRVTSDKIGNLFEWGEGLFGIDRQLHLFGPMQDDMRLPEWVKYHGVANPADLRANWYTRVCGLVTLSQHDEGRPQVMLEAMAAGLPVIASDVSAHRDIVQHGETGYLASCKATLTEGLRLLEDPAQNRKLGNSARVQIRERVGTWDDCAARYVEAYQALCASQN